MLAKHVLCCLSYVSSPLRSGYFGDRVSLLCPVLPGPQSSYFMLPTIAEMTGMHHHPSFFPLRWNLMNFLPGLAWNSNLPK
jgi:hypothetical protein